MFRDQREAEPGADTVAGGAATGEAFEDASPLATGHAGPDIVDRQRDAVAAVLFDLDRVGPPACSRAFSRRLARIRSKRSLSIFTVLGTFGSISIGVSPNP